MTILRYLRPTPCFKRLGKRCNLHARTSALCEMAHCQLVLENLWTLKGHHFRQECCRNHFKRHYLYGKYTFPMLCHYFTRQVLVLTALLSPFHNGKKHFNPSQHPSKYFYTLIILILNFSGVMILISQSIRNILLLCEYIKIFRYVLETLFNYLKPFHVLFEKGWSYWIQLSCPIFSPSFSHFH